MLALRFCALDQWTAKAHLFHFLGRHTMPRHVVDSVLRPDESSDHHFTILPQIPQITQILNPRQSAESADQVRPFHCFFRWSEA
jgi:hypothetical protein